MNGSKNKDVLSVTVDHVTYNAIEKVCSENKYKMNRSAFCNDLLKQALVANGMLEA